jgi:hypothetical protein
MPLINPDNIGGDLAKIFVIEFVVLAVVIVLLRVL